MPNRYTSDSRTHHLLSMLMEGERLTIRRVVQTFEVCQKTARRDLKFLERTYQLDTYHRRQTKIWEWPEDSDHSGLAAPPNKGI